MMSGTVGTNRNICTLTRVFTHGTEEISEEPDSQLVTTFNQQEVSSAEEIFSWEECAHGPMFYTYSYLKHTQ